MSKATFWILSALLVCGAIFVLFIYLPGRQSELAKKGLIADGTVQMKDQRPAGPDGGSVFFVTLLYQDAQGKNHQVTRQMFDAGEWDSLAAGKDIKVRYLPSDPDNGSIPGAEGMTTPRAGAFKFLAYTALLAAIIMGFLAYRAPKQSGRGPVVARR